MRKRIITFLIVLCMAGSVFGGYRAKAEENTTQNGPEKRYTFQDFGLKSGTHITSEGNPFTGDIRALLDGGIIHEKITVHREGENNQFLIFFRDSDGNWDGLRFQTYGGGIEVSFSSELRAGENMAGDNFVYILPQYLAGRDTFLDSEYDLKLKFHIGGENGEDLLLQIYIDDVLYTAGGTDADCVNGLITIPNAVTTILEKESANLDIISPGGTTIAFKNPNYQFTFQDFGLEDGTYVVSEANAFQGNIMNLLNGGVLHEKLITHITSSAYNHYLIFFRDSDGAWGGLRFMTHVDGSIELSFSKELRDGELMPGDNIVYITSHYLEGRDTFVNSEFDLKIKFNIGGEQGEDLLLQIYIDDVLYIGDENDKDIENGLITVPNGVRTIKEKASANLDMIALGDTNVTIKAPEQKEESNYTEFSFDDFGGMTEGAYPNQTLYKEFTGDISKLLNNGILRQTMEVSRGSTGGFVVLFSDLDNPWKGIQLNFLPNGAITVVIDEALRGNEAMAGDAVFDILPSYVGQSTFLNEEFEIAFDFSTSGADNEDLEMKIYINNVHYNGIGDEDYKNGVAMIPNAASVIKGDRQNISMHFANDGVVTLLPNDKDETIDTEPTMTEECYNLVQRDGTLRSYLVSGEGEITINGISSANGTTLSLPGDYIVSCTGARSYEKYVCLYIPGQACPDDKIDIKDFMAGKKIVSDVGNATRSAKLGADVNRDNAVTELDLQSICDYLMFPGEKNLWCSSDSVVTYEKDVMPIGGYYGPYRVTDSDKNKTYDLVTDEVYSKLQDLGINLIVSSTNDYLYEPQTVLNQLEMAEKYGIDVYLSDGRTRNVDTDMSSYFKKYAAYSSFKGITVVDEPSTQNFGHAGSGSQMAYYASQSATINQYCNYLGYTNLLPRYQNLALNGSLNNDYRAYLQEYIDTYQPKMLSYDHYLFDRYTEGNNIAVVNHYYFHNLNVVREVSQEAGIPFWTFIQAGRNWEMDTNGTTTVNDTPSQSQLLWNVNTSLAYGAKGIQYFPLVQPNYFAYGENDTYDFQRNGLLGADGNETIWYEYAKEANKQIALVDEVLMNAESTKVLWTGYDMYQAILNGSVSDGKILKNIVTEYDTNNRQCSAIVGVFEYQGKTAYYVVNIDMNASRTVTLEFYENQKYQVLSEQLSEERTTNEGTNCNLNLVAGGAALVMIE